MRRSATNTWIREGSSEVWIDETDRPIPNLVCVCLSLSLSLSFCILVFVIVGSSFSVRQAATMKRLEGNSRYTDRPNGTRNITLALAVQFHRWQFRCTIRRGNPSKDRGHGATLIGEGLIRHSATGHWRGLLVL